MRADTVLPRSLFLAVIGSAVALAAAVGCSAPYKAKNGLPVCEDGDPSCNGDSNSDRPSRSSRSSSSSAPSAPEAADETPLPSATPDAGAASPAQDAGGPAVEPACDDLAFCCEELFQDGYDPSTCRGVVATNNGYACFTSYERYKEFGDCI